VTEARRNWNEIKRFDDVAHAEIFLDSPPDKHQLEQFVIDNVLMVSEELLQRTNNLLRNDENNGLQTIEKEDPINEWFASIFEHRMSYLGWRSGDQKPGGRSASGKSSGKPDGFVSNRNNKRIFVFEAFRLSCLDKTVINEHLDKIAGYDSIGCSPSVVMVYCAVADFNALCQDYIKYAASRQYNNFDDIDLLSAENRFETVATKANLRAYREIRTRESIPIVLYHVLLSFKQ
jgi:hypothetical protein